MRLLKKRELKVSREVRIGATVIIAIALFLYGFNFLKGKNIFTQRTKFYAVFDNVGGLTESNPVMIRGYAVGQVNKIFFHPNNSQKLVIELSLQENDLQIPKNTVAKIYSSGLLGGMAVELVFGNAKEFIESGDTLTSALDQGIMDAISKQAAPVKDKAEKLLVSVDSLVQSINAIFNNNAKGNLRSTINNLDKISLQIEGLVGEQREKLNGITGNINSITSNIKDNNEKLTNVIKNFSNISDSLAKSNITTTLNNANTALKSVSEVVEKINKGEGTLGLLLNDKKMYNYLESSSKDLDKLLIDMKEHPSRYVHFSVFGKKDKSSNTSNTPPNK